MSKYFDGEILSAYEDLNKEFEYKKENTKLQQQIIELQEQLEEKKKEIEELKESKQYFIVNYDYIIDKLQKQLKSQPKEIVEKIKNICCIEDKCEDGSFVLGINEKDLDTILKEYDN